MSIVFLYNMEIKLHAYNFGIQKHQEVQHPYLAVVHLVVRNHEVFDGKKMQ